MPDKNDPEDDESIDTFSRGDGEGRPGPDEAADPAALTSGEEDGYQTDTFSRNDDEGLPGVPEDAKP
jgi:hypothetical protein